MICSICKKETPCEHNSRKGAAFYKFKDGKLVPSFWDGLFDADQISPAPPGGFTVAPLFNALNKAKHCDGCIRSRADCDCYCKACVAVRRSAGV